MGAALRKVFDGLEQGHHDQVARRVFVEQAVHQAALFLQQHHLQQVAHRFGVADDGVANGLGAEAFAPAAGGVEDGQFAQRVGRVLGAGQAQRAGVVELAQQHGAFGLFVERAVVGFDACGGQQLGHHFFVFVGALAQVDGGEVKAEHLDRAHQGAQAGAGQRRAVVGHQRGFDGLQIGQEFAGVVHKGAWGATAWRAASPPVRAFSVPASRAYMPVRARR